MKKATLCIIFLALANSNLAQETSLKICLDSIQKLEQYPERRIHFLGQLSSAFVRSYPRLLLPAFEESKITVEQNEFHFDMNDVFELFSHIESIHYVTGNHEEAKSSVLQVIPFMLDANDSFNLSRAYFDIAKNDWAMDQLTSAVNFQRKSYAYSKSDTTSHIHAAANLGIFIYSNGELGFQPYFEEAVSLAKKVNDVEELNYIYSAYLDIQLEYRNYDSANYWLDQIDQIVESNPHERMILDLQQGEIFIGMGLVDSAMRYLKRSEQAAKKTNSPFHLVEIHGLFAEIYKNQGEIDQAFDHIERSYVLRDSIKQGDALKHLHEMNVVFEVEQNARKRAQAEAKSIQLEQQQLYLISGGSIGLLILIVFSSFLIQRNRRLKLENTITKKDHIILTKEHALKLEQEESLQLKVQLQEKELTHQTLMQSQQSQVIFETLEQLESLDVKDSRPLKTLLRDLNRKLNRDEDWEQFKLHFDRVHEGFFQHLQEISEDLTPKDIRFCAYVRMNLQTKEIAHLLGVSHRTVEGIRYRVRKKLGLDTKDDLVVFLMNA